MGNQFITVILISLYLLTFVGCGRFEDAQQAAQVLNEDSFSSELPPEEELAVNDPPAETEIPEASPIPNPSPMPPMVSDGTEPALTNRNDILFFGGFEPGTLDATGWMFSFGITSTNTTNITRVTGAEAFQGKSLKLRYLKDRYSVTPSGGIETRGSFERLGIGLHDELFMRYQIKFQANAARSFEWVKGGKLPGLAGQTTKSGCQPRNGTDGWSARYMWHPGGEIIAYLYLPRIGGYGTLTCGDGLKLNYGGFNHKFVPGQWHTLEQQIKLNTPGRQDGVIRVWLDGKLALERTNIPWRTVDNKTMKIGNLFMSSFFGGNSQDWAPKSDQYVLMDNFVIAKNYIGVPGKVAAPTPMPSPAPLPISCNNPAALGVSRKMVLNPKGGPRYGTFNSLSAIPLQAKEIVLTFDDGPRTDVTPKILDALAAECVKATFFMVGNRVDSAPALARRVATEGHSVGTHSYTHKRLSALSFTDASNDIARGVDAAERALAGLPLAQQPHDLFRFPEFAQTDALINFNSANDLITISADMSSEDWKGEAPAVTLERTMQRINSRGKGIVVFHDNQPNTALLLPELLRRLKASGYKIVLVSTR